MYLNEVGDYLGLEVFVHLFICSSAFASAKVNFDHGRNVPLDGEENRRSLDRGHSAKDLGCWSSCFGMSTLKTSKNVNYKLNTL
jgi:hypothetical protein